MKKRIKIKKLSIIKATRKVTTELQSVIRFFSCKCLKKKMSALMKNMYLHLLLFDSSKNNLDDTKRLPMFECVNVTNLPSALRSLIDLKGI